MKKNIVLQSMAEAKYELSCVYLNCESIVKTSRLSFQLSKLNVNFIVEISPDIYTTLHEKNTFIFLFIRSFWLQFNCRQ